MDRVPMFKAIRRGRLKRVVKLLDEDPALLESKDRSVDNEGTPITCAAGHGRLSIVRALLERGANIHAEETLGLTALSLLVTGAYVSADFEEVVATLLSRGADVNQKSINGCTPLLHASSVGVLRVLLEHLDVQGVNERNDDGNTALHFCTQRSQAPEMMELLLSSGAQVDIRNSKGQTPLIFACARSADLARITILLKHSRAQGVDQRDTEGRTALHRAVKYSDRVTTALLLAGADHMLRDERGVTPRDVARRNWDLWPLFEWWERELERPCLVYRARCLHDASSRGQPLPPCHVTMPSYLTRRVAAGQALPLLDMSQLGEDEGGEKEKGGERGSCKRKGGGETTPNDEETTAVSAEEPVSAEERRAMLRFVVTGLNDQLFAEFMQGFHSPKGHRWARGGEGQDEG